MKATYRLRLQQQQVHGAEVLSTGHLQNPKRRHHGGTPRSNAYTTDSINIYSVRAVLQPQGHVVDRYRSVQASALTRR